MGVAIHEVVGTVQRAPEAPAARPEERRAGREAPLAEDAVRAFLRREAEMAARVRAD